MGLHRGLIIVISRRIRRSMRRVLMICWGRLKGSFRIRRMELRSRGRKRYRSNRGCMRRQSRSMMSKSSRILRIC